jgi:transposase
VLAPREPGQRSFFDASFLAPDQSCFEFARFYAREIVPLATDRDFEAFYSERGRPAVSPSLLLHVLVLATIEGLSDRRAVHALQTRLDWQLALGQRIDAPVFDATRLTRFRSRLLGRDSTNDSEPATKEERARARLLFDRIVEKLLAVGLIKKGQATRVDSTHVTSASKNINRYQAIFESLRLAIRAIDATASDFLLKVGLEPLREAYATRPSSYDLSKDRVRKNLDIAVKAGVRLLNSMRRPEHSPLRALDAVQVLARAINDNVEIRKKDASGKKRGRPPKAGSPGATIADEERATLGQPGGLAEEDVEVVARQSGDRMITPHDRTARLGVKSGGKLRWVGRKLHAAETVPEKPGESSFIVDAEMTPANVPDVKQALPTLERLNERGLKPERLYADAGYISGEGLALAQSRHGTELYGPPPQPRATGRLPVARFCVDFETGCATCPAERRSDSFKAIFEDGRLTGADARFGKATCTGCPLASECLGKGQTARTVHFTAHHKELVAQREKARTPEFKAEYKKRSPCEGIFSELTGSLRMRRSSLKGDLKTYFEHLLGVTVINIKRLHKALTNRPELAPVRC